MEDRTGKKWSREETILAYDLYCRTPFSKISQSNKDIIALAELLGRTPSSVGLKMANLAHYDPELMKRNISGMSHGSKLDQEICEEFAGNWELLSLQAQEILAEKKGTTVETMLSEELDIENIPAGEYRNAQIKQRVGQYFFRTTILNAYGNRCCITGLNKTTLLNASHIKPWSVSDERTERTNPKNGLCLNALHDRAFDRGLITVDQNYEIVISTALKSADMDEATKNWLMRYEHQKIILPDKFLPGKNFIEYHNDMIFLH